MTTLREDPRALRPGEPPVLLTARHLLRHLRADRAAPEEQRRVVEEWLATHQPGEPLTTSLRKHGLLPGSIAKRSAA